MKPLWVTAFDRFGKFEENPSAVLVENLSLEKKIILPVCYKEVQKWIESQAQNSEQPRALLMLGVSDSAPHFRLELCARNYAGNLPDVEGFSWGARPIDVSAPQVLFSTLFPAVFQTEGRTQDFKEPKPLEEGLSLRGKAHAKGDPSESVEGGRALLLEENPFPFAPLSYDAGDYLCNFAYFLALRRLPRVLCGFIHVPSFDRVPQQEQLAWLEQILEVIKEKI